MAIGAIFLSFLNACLTVAFIIFVAFVILWVLRSIFSMTVDGEVLKWGKIIVVLMCVIVFFGWLLSIFGSGVGPVGLRIFR